MSKFGYKKQSMTSLAIRKKLVSYMHIADEKKVKAIYALLEEDIRQQERINIEEYNKDLEEAEAEYAKGDYVTNEEMKKKIKQW